MTSTPFRDTVKSISRTKDYIEMQVESDKARSHSWWRNVVEYGPWRGPGNTRVGPPTPDEFPGIAKLFGTSEEQVQAMIAADWYNIEPHGGVSPRVMNLAPMLDQLSDEQADALGVIVRALVGDEKA
ncbi:hypothetical protein [Streptomyces sp. NPDC018711]|uniref:hypothetical protein n=1 Tax=Streptomyces sp. NPDC018711 TaxID=3365052 RepID=UPI0037A47DD5